VPQCTTGRVFLLKILSADIMAFFWMQEPKTDKDDFYLSMVNRLINAPPEDNIPLDQDQLYKMFQAQNPTPTPAPAATNSAASSSSTTATTTAAAAAAATQTTSNPSASTSTTTSAPSATQSASSQKPAQPLDPLAQLQSILSGIQVPEAKPEANLNKLLSPEHLLSLFQDPAIVEKSLPFIPDEAEKSKAELEDIIRSPQFFQAVATLNAGLRSGDLASLLAELGLDPSIGGPLGGVEAFIRAIQAKVDQEKKKSQ
jgi:26S proteasome regulatory subunit N13